MSDRTMEAGRCRIVLEGAVQGVGLRPFVYRLATSLSLGGYVQNSSDGLVIEVEGDADRLEQFAVRLTRERPPAALVTAERVSHVPPVGATAFVIAASQADAHHQTGMLNDLATCADCLREILDPANRRHGYPFTNCTACGPRFTIIERLPYDRASTTMGRFEMCDACRTEYDSPSNRRYHAQPNACARCGPKLSSSIAAISQALRAGSIVALKGVGGFHLLCDARDSGTVARLRQRKARDFKPFAVLMPSLDEARAHCFVNADEAAVLTSPASPIVLLRPRVPSVLAPEVSGRAPFVGVLLPYSPLHHLLMREHATPIVATSGNIPGEPIAIDDDQAREQLGSIADVTVTHDRPIARPCDDSVVRVGGHGPSILRRARGFAPLPIHVDADLPAALAVGGHLKSTIAIGVGRHAVVSQHLGDLDTAAARHGFEAAIDDMCRAYRFTPEFVVADRHPDYASRQWAESSGFKVVEVQHHQAHVAACALENGVSDAYLGVAWDGAGLGDDGTVWGGEFFGSHGMQFDRVAHLRPFRLLGGDAAAREGWRVVLAMDWHSYGNAALDGRGDAGVLEPMLRRGVNAPWSTSVGRLFDAVAWIAGVCDGNRFEGESALALEAAIDPRAGGSYPFGEGLTGDWEPLIDAVRRDLDRNATPGTIAARFHRALVNWICRVADCLQAGSVVLSGGVFQNAFLVDRAVAALTSSGRTVHTHRRVPANDGGLSLGQLAVARHHSHER
jgi:hydrogenase maturation protein HypF